MYRGAIRHFGAIRRVHPIKCLGVWGAIWQISAIHIFGGDLASWCAEVFWRELGVKLFWPAFPMLCLGCGGACRGILCVSFLRDFLPEVSGSGCLF